MLSRRDVLEFALSMEAVYQDAPFHDDNWQLVRMKENKKSFLMTYERNGLLNLNVKVSEEMRDFWRKVYPSVIPGWHVNKEHWNTIIVDGTVPKKDVFRMIEDSYELVAKRHIKRK